MVGRGRGPRPRPRPGGGDPGGRGDGSGREGSDRPGPQRPIPRRARPKSGFGPPEIDEARERPQRPQRPQRSDGFGDDRGDRRFVDRLGPRPRQSSEDRRRGPDGRDAGPPVLTVSEVQRKVKRVVEGAFAPVWVVGEVSNLRRPRSGHVYFTLKDSGSTLECVMFRTRLDAGMPVPIDNGMEVLVFGRLSTYEASSKVQIIVDRAEPHGQGRLELERERLRRRFASAGLFRPQRKRPLPPFPKRVGIVTSPTGAAIRDILTTLDRRWPRLHVIIAASRVQGNGAELRIADAIAALNRVQPALDVIIVARGGGSIEDLWCFNLPPVVEAIADSAIPVVTGVGHEIDETLADLVADLRTPTPTAAAEAVAPNLREIEDLLAESGERLGVALQRRLGRIRERLDRLRTSYGFRFVNELVTRRERELDDLDERLRRALGARLRDARSELDRLAGHYGFRAPAEQIRRRRQMLEELGERLEGAARARLREARRTLEGVDDERLRTAAQRRLAGLRERLAREAGRLEALSPLAVLSRGYSVTLRGDAVLRRASDVAPGDRIEVRLEQGRVEAEVTGITPAEPTSQESGPNDGPPAQDAAGREEEERDG